jgi:cbb3-type cytochrome oxidase subunit 3
MHLLFGFTLLITLIFLVVEYTLYHHYNTNSIDSSSLEKAVGVTDHFNNFTSLVSILYLSLGLSTVRETLNDKEKRFDTAVLVLYFIFYIWYCWRHMY